MPHSSVDWIYSFFPVFRLHFLSLYTKKDHDVESLLFILTFLLIPLVDLSISKEIPFEL